MNKFLLLPAVATFATLLLVASHEQSYAKTTNVHGYTKKDGTTVSPHRRTSPNNTQRDNWSSKPNTNPDNGKQGSKEPSH